MPKRDEAKCSIEKLNYNLERSNYFHFCLFESESKIVMKGVLYYFSGTGNTKWVADRFKEDFAFYNIDVDLFDMQFLENKKSENYDFLIIGSPVYAEFPPKIVTDFLSEIDDLKRRMKAVVYSTQAASSSSVPGFISKCLVKKGYMPVIQISIKMPNNFYFVKGKKPDKNTIEKLLLKADEKVKGVVKSFVEGKSTIETVPFIRFEFNKIIYSMFKNRIPKLSKNISSTEDCGKCGLCLRNCPESNITFEGGHAIFHSKCILCLRCIHICPINAVRYKGEKIDQTQKNIMKTLDLNR
jgi:ferredoxin